jgi:3'-phosphoadenosine 5'-phosphosulfate sulfotransferase (PAPS reductase)/FAD synthetase
MKHIVCYSGGHSSALVAIEVTRAYGVENTILLNHNIHPSVEPADVKRFKQQVADYLGIPITYANHPKWDKKDQFDVVVDAKAFKVGRGEILCTSKLKTAPFNRYLKEHFPEKDCTIYYGFDRNEMKRVQRRIGVLGSDGYKTDYPLALWADEGRTIWSTEEVGILRPNTYGVFKHGNCTGCLKAGKQHWYIVYLTRKDLWEKGKWAEDTIGYSIHNGWYLEDVEEDFAKMKCLGITTTEHELGVTFFARVRKIYRDIEEDGDNKPCDCSF